MDTDFAILQVVTIAISVASIVCSMIGVLIVVAHKKTA